MKPKPSHDEKIANLEFSKIYPLYVAKIEKKGRSIAELESVIKWLTGFDAKEIEKHIQNHSTFDTFFKQATLHPLSSRITGTICGYRVEDISNPLTQKIRYLDKLVDELAKGKPIEKIIRI